MWFLMENWAEREIILKIKKLFTQHGKISPLNESIDIYDCRIYI